MNDKLARDIMVPLEKYPCIPETVTLGDAIMELAVHIMRVQELSMPRVALVFDDSFDRLLGILRRRDIMRGLEPRFLGAEPMEYGRKLFNVEIDPNLSDLSHDKIAAGMCQRADRLVKDYTSPIPATIEHDDHMMKAVYEMVHENTSLLPVMENGRVVGVVRSVDVLGEIALILGSGM